MAEENGTNRGFAPLTPEDINPPKPDEEPGLPPQRPSQRGMPSVQVSPKIVNEFETEVITKVSSGRKRMFWFANHFILFFIGIAVAIGLKLTIYEDLETEFIYLPLGGWVGLLAIHLRYALVPVLRKTEGESQLKAVIPDKDENGNGY